MRLWPKSKNKKINTTKNRIKEATFELLVENGYASLSMREISKKANTALGQLTYYYATKEKLILEVIDEISNTIIIELKDNIAMSKSMHPDFENYLNNIDEKNKKICIALINIIAQSIYNEKINEKTHSLYNNVKAVIANTYNTSDNNKEDCTKIVNNLLEKLLGKMVIYNMERNFNEIK